MRVDSNPFFSRASEYIELDDKFIKLFSPEILHLFKEFKVWTPVKIFRSSPGAGKTTLLKIFTSKILLKIQETYSKDAHRAEIFKLLTGLEVFNNLGEPTLAGSLVSFNNEYASLEFLELNNAQKIRFFVSLLNTRITLSILQSISQLKKLKFPQDLSQISISIDQTAPIPSSIRSFTNGQQFYNWACALEEKICLEIDSIYDINTSFLEGSDDLFPLDVFAPNNISINGEHFVDRVLIMLDDVHNLTLKQRQYLFETILNKRPSVHVWISERLKALTMDEILSEGNTEERDSITIHLENHWRRKQIAFEKFAKSVADRRIEPIFEDRDDFSTILSTRMDGEDLIKIQDALKVVVARIKQNYGSHPRYVQWLSTRNQTSSEPYDLLVSWRTLEILLFRDRNNSQKSIEFDTDILKDEELKEQEGNDVINAAKLFLNSEFGIPFYYGISNITKLASFNIEQFLMIAGHLFEIVLTNSIRKIVNPNFSLELSPQTQEEIIKRTVNKKKWQELNTKVPNFTEVRRFLDAIGASCKAETYTPNAWNSPGINGIAILMTDRKLLKETALKDPNHIYYNLAKCIATCIAYNLLDFRLNYRVKNKDWMVLYINRIYCVKYNLPMNDGRFKERTLPTLLGWYNNGFQSKNQKQLEI